MSKNKVLMSAAIAGIIGVATMANAKTANKTTAAAKAVTGQCIGANACKGQSACHTDNNACKGQNGCAGKGMLETTKAECDAKAATDKNIHFTAGK